MKTSRLQIEIKGTKIIMSKWDGKERKIFIEFCKQIITRKSFDMDKLMDILPMDVFKKYVEDGKEDLILDKVLSVSNELQNLVNNLGLYGWKKPIHETKVIPLDIFKLDFGSEYHNRGVIKG